MIGAAIATGLTAVIVPGMPTWYLIIAALMMAYVGVAALAADR
jgi:hypothetical protein